MIIAMIVKMKIVMMTRMILLLIIIFIKILLPWLKDSVIVAKELGNLMKRREKL